jgi:hypothetical protein
LLAAVLLILSATSANAAVTSLTLGTGQNGEIGAVMDSANGFAYFAINASPGQIVKIRLSDFTVVSSLTLSVNDPVSGVIDSAHGFAYFGTDDWPAKIVKVDLATFTEVGTITLGSGENDVERAAIDTVNGFAYFIPYYSGGKVAKIDINPSHFAEVDVLVLADPNNVHLNCVVIDPTSTYLYLGTDGVPGRVIKVSLFPFAYVGYIALTGTERYLSSAVIDPANGFLYFGATAIASAPLTKIDIPTFTRIGEVASASTVSHLSSAVIDMSNGYAYFGAYGEGSDPYVVLEYNLSNFSIAATITLATSGAQYPKVALIDTTGGYAYFASDASPVVIYRIPLISKRFDQKHFKIFQDNAVLNSATLYAAEDTNYNPQIGADFRIRFEVVNTGTLAGNISRRLEFREDSGSWTQITSNSNDVRLSDSSNFSDGDATTSLLTSTGTFIAGQGKDTGATTSSVSLTNNYYTEDEYSLIFQSAAAGHTYQFRVSNNGTALNVYSQIPSITPYIPHFTITSSADSNGLISPSGDVSVTSGADQSFSISPNSGYQISDVLVDGSSVGAVSSYSFTGVAAAHTISAVFSAQPATPASSSGAVASGAGGGNYMYMLLMKSAGNKAVSATQNREAIIQIKQQIAELINQLIQLLSLQINQAKK